MKGIAQVLRSLLLAALPLAGWAADEQLFDIHRFDVQGNTLLPAAQVRELVMPFEGRRRNYADIQRALETLENAYRQAGYGTVQVFVPEQELTQGTVRLRVLESVIGKVEVSGNRRFSTANVRAGLPALREGRAPNLRQLSENVQLSNENPAKQVEVTLGVSAEEGKVDAKVAVKEDDPEMVFVTLDKTGNPATGRYRLGVAYQHANLFDRDHTFTAAYTTAPDKPSGVEVDVFSIGYRVPFHAIGDSFDLVYGKSTTATPSSSPSLGGALGIVGKGEVLGLRWNHYFPRRGEYSAKLVFGLDYKDIRSTCTSNNGTVVEGVGTCVRHTLQPLSATYLGKRQRPGQAYDYSLGLAWNLPTGRQYDYTTAAGTTGTDRFSLVALNRPTRDDFRILRFSGSFLQALAGDWQLRLAGAAQSTRDPLPLAEQMGLAGSTAVRGFRERAMTTDSGLVLNAELYTPDWAARFGLPGNLRGVAFFDAAHGRNHRVGAPTVTLPVKTGLASAGIGLRYGLAKDIVLRADLASVIEPGTLNSHDPGQPSANAEAAGEWRGHFSLILGF